MPGATRKKIPGMLPCLVPSWPEILQIWISFRSRSDLVLDADHAIYIYICRRVSFGTTFLAFQELETVPPFLKKSFLQHPEPNQELETDPPDS